MAQAQQSSRPQCRLSFPWYRQSIGVLLQRASADEHSRHGLICSMLDLAHNLTKWLWQDLAEAVGVHQP
jgi:hypothetical protein